MKKPVFIGATVAIVAAMVTAPAVASPASAADLMTMCNGARSINGVAQPDRGVGWQFTADTCDWEETSFSTYSGATKRLTVWLPNCEAGSRYSQKITQSVSDVEYNTRGVYDAYRSGLSLSILDALELDWQRHGGTFNLTTKAVTWTDSQTVSVPPGWMSAITFTPLFKKMQGRWHIHINAGGDSPWTQSPAEDYYLNDTVTGPARVGFTNIIDGTVSTVNQRCS